MMNVIERLASRDNQKPGDYKKDGLLMCGCCHAPKQKIQKLPKAKGGYEDRVVPITCLCERKEDDKQREQDEKSQRIVMVRELQDEYNVSDSFYRKLTFDQDDRRDAEKSDICRNYVDRWGEVEADSLGVLFYGSVGTGKSFFACCIANALLENGVPTAVTNFPRLLNILQSTKDRQRFIDHLGTYRLLVVDDLGVERDSPFATEQVYNIIDSRARSGLPLIITSNLTMDEMQNPPTMQLKRIYDRILEMCPIVVKMNGESRRAGNAERRKQKAREILLGKRESGGD